MPFPHGVPSVSLACPTVKDIKISWTQQPESLACRVSLECLTQIQLSLGVSGFRRHCIYICENPADGFRNLTWTQT